MSYYLYECVQGMITRIWKLDGSLGYRDGLSFNSFFNGLKYRNCRPQKKEALQDGTFYSYMDVHDYASRLKTGKVIAEMLKSDKFDMPKPVDVGSLQEFYDLIGYNRKTKRWK